MRTEVKRGSMGTFIKKGVPISIQVINTPVEANNFYEIRPLNWQENLGGGLGASILLNEKEFNEQTLIYTT